MTAIPATRERQPNVRELDWLMLITMALCCLGLVMAVRTVLRNGLRLLGISAPEQM